ncbi:MAG: response regulator [SAR202 cluster bacterium]|nr:response regulator [SAR202 cluster bacterium]
MTDKVLVVDDEQPVRDLLLTWLEEAGYETCFGTNGLEGLQALYEHRPDLVIADIMMPEMDGFEFCRQVRQVSKAPIMILSGLGQEVEKIKGFDLGADDYVVKPVGMDEFLARAAALIRGPGGQIRRRSMKTATRTARSPSNANATRCGSEVSGSI